MTEIQGLAARKASWTIQDVFPDAPAGATPPVSVSKVLGAYSKEWASRNRAYIGVWLAVLIVVPAILWLANPDSRVWLAPVAAMTAVLIVVMWWLSRVASKRYWELYAKARGLTIDQGGSIPARLPLLRRGDHQRFDRVLRGRICGTAGALAHFTYVTESTDSDGNTQHTDHPYTVVQLRLPDAVGQRFVGVYCRPGGIRFGLGKLADKLTSETEVELESSEFNKRYNLSRHDSQEEIALYELFSTTFIDLLASELEVTWEQASGDLMAFCKGHLDETARIDALCSGAARVYGRYCEEAT